MIFNSFCAQRKLDVIQPIKDYRFTGANMFYPTPEK